MTAGTLRGIVAMLAACACFACMDALLKALAGHFPPLQVTALRGLTSLPLVCLYVLWRREAGALFSRRLRWGLHLLRGVLTIVMLVLFTTGLKTLGLAEAYTLTFVAPLVITMLSVPLLGERVRPRHWVAIAAGFGGVLVALRPRRRRWSRPARWRSWRRPRPTRWRTCWAGWPAAPSPASRWSSGPP